MKIQVFGSSSAGNCVRVYNDICPGVYFDAGVNPSLILNSGAPLANMPFFITHEHGDHSKYVADLRKLYAAEIYASAGTLTALSHKSGKKLRFKNVCIPEKPNHPCEHCTVFSFPIVHFPAEEPVCFVIEICGERMLFLIDCGQVPDQKSIPLCDFYFIEANFTPAALETNFSQWSGVKGRTQSGFGHLSVLDAYEFIKPRLGHAKKIVFGHMSASNFDMDEYKRLIPPDVRAKITLARPGTIIDTDPF